MINYPCEHKSPSILTLDPGESTGWCLLTHSNDILAGTKPKDYLTVAQLIENASPDIVVYETFNLYPGKAQKLIWNSFYPCEVIGVIRYICTRDAIPCLGQAPPVKKYAGPLPKKFVDLSRKERLTEHSKDACRHLCYYLRQVGAIDRVLH